MLPPMINKTTTAIIGLVLVGIVAGAAISQQKNTITAPLPVPNANGYTLAQISMHSNAQSC